MSSVRILPEEVASQIAAGEVIERPSSVVRELIDNSIDAGADRIVINLENGGRRLVSVADNGSGMSRDDLLLCIERHATSKISTSEDLFSIRSLGFRGEAIPSVASVSRLHIKTRQKDDLSGHSLKINGGRLISIDETGSPPGTTVEVKDLFYNVPARRKFLRAAKTETDRIADVVSRISIPYNDIYFSLEQGGNPILNLPPADDELFRLFYLLGKDVAESMLKREEKGKSVSVKAYLAPPEFARKRGDRLFVYVNGRNVRDRLITKAIMDGFGSRLMKGRYPQAVLFLEIEPNLVDINVHPTKQEVRFSDSAMIFKRIASTVDSVLGSAFSRFEGLVDPWRESSFTGVKEDSLHRDAWEFAPSDQRGMLDVGTGERDTRVMPQTRVIGQLANTYILCQMHDGLLMVDQHAAHERIIFEGLSKGFENSRIESQQMLVPFELELTLKEKQIAVERADELLRLGMELEHFGGNTFLLRSFPVILSKVDWGGFISELLVEMGKGELEDKKVFECVITIMACHGAIKAGDRLSEEEIYQLLVELEEMETPTNCPHGRPIFKHFTFYDLEKMFKRVV